MSFCSKLLAEVVARHEDSAHAQETSLSDAGSSPAFWGSALVLAGP
jgi:hypothetical protein